MKIIGYLLFASVFYLVRIFCPIDKKKVFCIMTHDGSQDSSVGVVVQALRKMPDGYHFVYLRKEDTSGVKGLRRGKLGAVFPFFFKKPYDLATAAYILQDNIFLPMAYLHFSKKVKVVQLWHGTGTIKKFGQSVNTGQLGKLEKRANRTITHLIVNSEYTKKQYKEAFGIEEKNIFVLGLPRTDIMLDKEKRRQDEKRFYEEFPDLKGKKLVLYVPTFRDQETENPKMEMSIPRFLNDMPEEYVLGFRLHPFVARTFSEKWNEEKNEGGRIYNFSGYPDLNTLLFISYCLVTDYSSVIFEYCLLEKPMYFYAYDLEEFSQNGRGFYENYEEYVPGPVAGTMERLLDSIRKKEFNKGQIRRFKEESYRYLDGNCTKRVIYEIFMESD